MKIHPSLRTVTTAFVSSVLLLACGGGGSNGQSTGASSAGIGSTTVPPPVFTTPVSPASPVVPAVPPPVTPAVAPTSTVTVASINGPRTFTVPQATIINNRLDTVAADITGEASLALWPMVATIGSDQSVAGKLTPDLFPAGIWPIYFKYVSQQGSDRTDPNNGTSTSNYACSLDLIAGVLVATVDGKTFSAPIDDLPAYTTTSFGNPQTGDGYRRYIVATGDGLFTKRMITVQAEASNAYVDPKYGPRNAGPSIKLLAVYDEFNTAALPTAGTNLFVYFENSRTGGFTQYICKDQLR